MVRKVQCQPGTGSAPELRALTEATGQPGKVQNPPFHRSSRPSRRTAASAASIVEFNLIRSVATAASPDQGVDQGGHGAQLGGRDLAEVVEERRAARRAGDHGRRRPDRVVAA